MKQPKLDMLHMIGSNSMLRGYLDQMRAAASNYLLNYPKTNEPRTLVWPLSNGWKLTLSRGWQQNADVALENMNTPEQWTDLPSSVVVKIVPAVPWNLSTDLLSWTGRPVI